jgi:histone H2A
MSRDYHTYLYRLLRQVHPDMGISARGMDVMNGVVEHVVSRMADTTNVLVTATGQHTAGYADLLAATRITLPRSLGDRVRARAETAVDTVSKWRDPASGRGSRTHRAGLIFPVPRMSAALRSMTVGRVRQGRSAGVYLASVVQYVVLEVLTLAGDLAKEAKKGRVIPRHISLAIRKDYDLDTLLGRGIVPEGGVLPGILPALLPRPRKQQQEPETTAAYPLPDA